MKNEYRINKSLIMSWAKEYHIFGASGVITFVLNIVIGLSGLAQMILFSIFGADWTSWFLAALFVVYSVYMLFFSRFVFSANRFKMVSKAYGVTEWTRITEFTDEEIVLSDHNSITRFKYENIKRIKDAGESVIIVFNQNLSIRFLKNTFVEGSWEECKAFLEAKRK